MLIEIILASGAGAATLSRLIAREEGPYQVFSRLREWAIGNVRKFESEHADSKRAIEFLNEALEVLGCPICQSVWWGAALALLGGLAAGLSPALVVLAMLGAPSIAWAIGSTGKWFD